MITYCALSIPTDIWIIGEESGLAPPEPPNHLASPANKSIAEAHKSLRAVGSKTMPSLLEERRLSFTGKRDKER
jgi:hypothetical protein